MINDNSSENDGGKSNLPKKTETVMVQAETANTTSNKFPDFDVLVKAFVICFAIKVGIDILDPI